MKRIAVIGLGRFGMSLARQLADSGADVIAVDRTAPLVNEIKDDVADAVRLDSTDETALRSQDIDKVDICVVCMGENFEAALLTTVLARKLNIPTVICRAQTKFHAEIFRQIGADEVIQPETHAGQHLGHRLANDHIEHFISLADNFTLIELRPPREFQEKSLQQIGLRSRYNVNLVGIRRLQSPGSETRTLISVSAPDEQIQADDILIVVGADDALAKLPAE